MTEEQEQQLEKIGEAVAHLFPEMYGNVRFNLKAGKVVNYNVTESVIAKETS